MNLAKGMDDYLAVPIQRGSQVMSYSSNSHCKNRFFEIPPLAGFQKTDFSVSSAEGAGNTKIGSYRVAT